MIRRYAVPMWALAMVTACDGRVAQTGTHGSAQEHEASAGAADANTPDADEVTADAAGLAIDATATSIGSDADASSVEMVDAADGDADQANAPQILTLSAGGTHTCALFSDGTVRCWGNNQYGQLGDGTTNNSATPVTVANLHTAAGIAAGSDHTCAIVSGGKVVCWGSNRAGQLALSSGTIRSAGLVVVPGLVGATAIAAGANHTCAIVVDGTLRCWGDYSYGALGQDTTTFGAEVTVPGLSGVVGVSGGTYQTCASLIDGTIRCWGLLTEPLNSSPPVAISNVSGATAVSAAYFFGCALLSDGGVTCWGDNFEGQLGNGTTTPVPDAGNALSPASLTGSSVANLGGRAVGLSAADYHACALLAGGTVKCWGDNQWGELGDATMTSSSIPASVTGLTGVAEIAVGGAHGCALLSGGAVECWGSNELYQLGVASTTDTCANQYGTAPCSLTPVTVVW
jgi:alpha-tubulin suppressor-like RCC1 family protein